MKRFEYRRQFLAGKRFFGTEKFWKHIQITENLKLSVHRDLSLNRTQEKNREIFLLGYMIDPLNPAFTNSEILDLLLDNSPDFSSLIGNTYRMSGRWILIFVQDKKVFFVHDPFGMRQIYYTNIQGERWCGSEPSILADCLNLEPDKKDEKLATFIHSNAFKKKEHFWVGDKTRYREILHLLPNHYLEIQSGKVQRFWTNNEKYYSLQEAVGQAGELLKNSLISANKRFKLMMPVTAGWDSRVLLAASKSIKNELFYFVSTKNQLTDQDDDIQIPKNLFGKLELDFHILDNLKQPDDEFLRFLKKNVDLPRGLPKTLTFYEFYLNHQDKVNINGRGAETVRSYYPFDKKPSADFLAKVTGYANDPFVLKETKAWLQDARPFAENNSIDLTDLYYWEQRMGNWGGTDPVEQDIAIEEFCPFNNRQLMMILLSTKRKYRTKPNYKLHKELISYLWKDLLNEAINPIPVSMYASELIKSKIPYHFKIKIKKSLSIYPYDQ